MAEEKKSFFARLREGLTKTRNNCQRIWLRFFRIFRYWRRILWRAGRDDDYGRPGRSGDRRDSGPIKRTGQWPGNLWSSGLPGDLNRQHPGADACRQDSLWFWKRAVRCHGDRRKRCRQDDFDWKTRFQVKEAGTQGLNRGGGYVPCGSWRSAGGMGEPRRCRYDRRRRGLWSGERYLRRGQCGKSTSCGRSFMRYGGTSPQ